MVSKSERKKLLKFLEMEQRVLDFELLRLFVDDLKFDRKIRNKAIRLSRKRKVVYIT